MKLIIIIMALFATCSFCNEWITIFDKNELYSGASIVQTSDGAFLVAGVVVNEDIKYRNYTKASINKLESNGSLIWNRTYSILDNYNDIYCYPSVMPFDILDLGNEGYIFCGKALYTDTLVQLIEFGYITMMSEDGNVIWEEAYDISKFVKIFKTEEGYIAFGTKHTENISLSSLKAIKIDHYGNVVWEKEYTKSEGFNDLILNGQLFPQIDKLSNNRYAISGPGRIHIDDNSNLNDAFVMTINGNGEVLSLKSSYSGGGTQLVFTTETRDQNLLTSGLFYERDKQAYSSFLLKINHEGDTLWMKTYQNPNLSYSFHSLIKIPNGDFLIYGLVKNKVINESDAYIVRTDPDGYVKDEYYFGGANDDYIFNGIAVSDSMIIIIGKMSNSESDDKAYIAAIKIYEHKIEDDVFLAEQDERGNVEKENPVLPSEIFFIAYPNPFNNECSFRFDYSDGNVEQFPEINIYNINGQLIHQIPATDEISNLIWQPNSETPSGKYLASCVVGRKKMMKLITYLK